MVRLGTCAQGRDNNLNLIRMIAASAVLVSHAWPIALGPEAPEPMKGLTGYSLGSLSVFVFFAVSGFLITQSFERTSSRTSFLLARGLRLFPGLAVNLIFVAFVLGPIVTVLPAALYFSMAEPYTFTLRNLALFPLVFDLPGVFEDQPWTSVVGSIWTLRHEVMCYAAVFLAGLAGAWKGRRPAAIALSIYAILWLTIRFDFVTLPEIITALHRLSVPFAMGTALYVWRDAIPLSLPIAVCLALLAALAKGTMLYLPALSLAIAYATFWLAYIPGGWVRSYNRLGDYSYGIYIYAFPLQGAAVWLMGPQTPWENILWSFPPTLVLSVLSWHIIEKPGMALKPRLMRWLGAPGRAITPADR